MDSATALVGEDTESQAALDLSFTHSPFLCLKTTLVFWLKHLRWEKHAHVATLCRMRRQACLVRHVATVQGP